MNENALRSSIQTEPRSLGISPGCPADETELAMQALMAEIADDALQAPELYLRDTVVPAGGE